RSGVRSSISWLLGSLRARVGSHLASFGPALLQVPRHALVPAFLITVVHPAAPACRCHADRTHPSVRTGRRNARTYILLSPERCQGLTQDGDEIPDSTLAMLVARCRPASGS